MTEKINAAIDCGAGTTKIRIGTRRKSHTISMPSLVSVVSKSSATEGATDIYSPAAFSLIDGEKEIFYFAGDIVRAKGLPSDDVFSEPILKVTNARKLVLAALIEGMNLNKGQSLEVSAIASHHDPMNFSDQIREALVGTHIVRKGNNTFKITISMPIRAVYPEGSAISEAFGEETPKEFGVLDLGFLTALWSTKFKEGTGIKSTKAPYGVGRLVEMLQDSSEFSKLLAGIQPERDVLIASLIEACQSKSLKVFYRSRGKAIDFTSIYKPIAMQWLKGAARSAVQTANEKKGTGFRVVAIGGGVNLPSISNILAKFGIESYSELNPDSQDAIFANVETLYLKHKSLLFNLEPELKLVPENDLKLVSADDASCQDDLEVADNA